MVSREDKVPDVMKKEMMEAQEAERIILAVYGFATEMRDMMLVKQREGLTGWDGGLDVYHYMAKLQCATDMTWDFLDNWQHGPQPSRDEGKEEVRRYCVHMANYCMMLFRLVVNEDKMGEK